MIGIIDYGAGNLHSVAKALKFLGCEFCFVQNPQDLRRVERLILPGVGAFGQAARELKKRRLWPGLSSWMREAKPLLGICLGMQLLLDRSEESPEIEGLGFLKGTCRKLRAKKVPHMGWNEVCFLGSHPLFEGLPDESCFYFVHSYYVCPEDSQVIRGITEYNLEFPSIIQKGRVLGLQFHPEKSGGLGLLLLRNWVEKC